LGRDTHLDPDFDTLTYGDDKKRGRELPEFAAGDFLAFYGAFRRIGERRPRPLIYGLIGYFEARGPGQRASEITDAKTRMENAHTRRFDVLPDDVVVRDVVTTRSGLFDRLIEIGERRGSNYYVIPEILEKWGGLSVKNGYLTQSANLPRFCKPESFQQWLTSECNSKQIKFVKPEYHPKPGHVEDACGAQAPTEGQIGRGTDEPPHYI